MTERPILFSAPMVRAIRAGTKTQTRRTVQPRGLGYIDCCCGGTAARWAADGDRWHCGTCGGGARLTQNDVEYLRCPYGQPGDRLWVRETWQGPLIPESEYTGPHERAKFNLPKFCQYAADGGPAPEFIDDDDNRHCRWRPSIHMPRWASRILLEVAAVRVERLQDISEADAQAEGATYDPGEGGTFHVPGLAGCASDSAAGSFRKLWVQINGPDSWDANPWVWVVGFRRLQAVAA